MKKRWRLPTHDAARIQQLENAARVPAVVAQLLLQRGLTQADMIQAFLEGKLTQLRDPEELPGATVAAEALHAAMKARKRIMVYGDYDADGMTATALLYNGLKLLGADVGYHLPSRLEEGYGLNSESLRTLHSRGVGLIVTVDCGIASIAEAETAREIGLELIVTDHHSLAEKLPNATAIVHPRLPGTAYPFGELCGAGVALKVAWMLCRVAENNGKKVSERLRDYLMRSLAIAAIGTVADVVPLVDENRILVRYGLQSLKSWPSVGLSALMKVTGLHDKPSLSSEDIAFTLAPRLNAAGRLGQAQLGVELLTTDSPERAQALAEYIHELNNSRDSLERSIYLAANKQAQEEFDPVNDPALVLAGRGWHQGVIGIVAGRLAEKFHRPVVLITLDQVGAKPGVGSARSAGCFNLHEALHSCKTHLIGFGGHAAAAGLKIDESNINAFRNEFVEYAATEAAGVAQVPELMIDAEILLSQITLETIDAIEKMAPFGQGNPRPVLCTTGAKLAEPPKRIGSGERHLSVKIVQHGVTIRGVSFGNGDWCEELTQHNGPIDIAYRPVINEFRGRRSPEIQLLDWRPVKAEALVKG